MPILLAAVLGLSLIVPLSARAQVMPASRPDTAAFRYLLGNWSVVSHRRGDQPAQPGVGETLHFAPAPAGVGLVSHWRMNRGTAAQPQMTEALYVLGYDPPSSRWSFYFVSERSAQYYEGRLDGARWYFYREYVATGGERMLQRQSWSRIGPTEVRRTIEDSPDAGVTWTVVYEGVLRRIP